MQISVSSTLTVYHDGQFWVGLAEHVEDGRYGVARIVFGAEPSDEEILRFVTSKWAKLAFFGDDPSEASEPAKNPKRRAREAAKALKQPAMSGGVLNAIIRAKGPCTLFCKTRGCNKLDDPPEPFLNESALRRDDATRIGSARTGLVIEWV